MCGGGATPASRQLAEQNIRLAYKVAYEFKRCGIEFEDVVSTCFVGLVKAANTYKSETGAAFSTYAVPVMRNEMLMALRKVSKQSGAAVISLDAELENGGLVAEMIPDEKDCFADLYVVDAYQRCAIGFSPREKEVVELLMLYGATQEQVGKKLGASQAYVSRIRKNAIEKLKKVI